MASDTEGLHQLFFFFFQLAIDLHHTAKDGNDHGYNVVLHVYTQGWETEETGNMSLSAAFSTASKPRGVTAAWFQ